MGTMSPGWLLALAGAIAFIGCARAEKSSEPAAQPVNPTGKQSQVGAAKSAGQAYRGWYIEHGGQGRLQTCGQSRQWRVESPELGVQAKEFGLDEDTPVYVRLFGSLSASGDELSVSRVDQFGSPTPVRDCPMTGVVIPAPDPGA